MGVAEEIKDGPLLRPVHADAKEEHQNRLDHRDPEETLDRRSSCLVDDRPLPSPNDLLRHTLGERPTLLDMLRHAVVA